MFGFFIDLNSPFIYNNYILRIVMFMDNEFIFDYQSNNILDDNQFIDRFTLFYYQKLLSMDTSDDEMFLKFIDYLRIKIVNTEGKIDITPVINMFINVISKYDTKNINYDNFICFIKEKCAYVASSLYVSLNYFYPEELQRIEKIIIDDVSLSIHNSDNKKKIASIIYGYASEWLYEGDDNFYIASNSLNKLDEIDLANKLISLGSDYTDKITSFIPSYGDNISR